MFITAYYPQDDSMDVCFEDEGVHLTQADLTEYEQIIRDYCL